MPGRAITADFSLTSLPLPFLISFFFFFLLPCLPGSIGMLLVLLGLGSRHEKTERVYYPGHAMLYTGQTKLVQVWGQWAARCTSKSGK